MENPIILIAGGIILGLLIGYIGAKVLEKNNASKLIKGAKKSAAAIIKEANIEGESMKKDKILQAKEKFIELKSEHEKVILTRDKKMAEAEKRTRDKESQISSELAQAKKSKEELEAKLKDYEHRVDILDKKKVEIDDVHDLVNINKANTDLLKLVDVTIDKKLSLVKLISQLVFKGEGTSGNKSDEKLSPEDMELLKTMFGNDGDQK